MLNILYCFDQNYNIQAATSISSLANKLDEDIRIYIIHEDPNSFKEYKKKLENEKFINSIHIFEFQNKNYDFPNLNGSHVSFATYFRLFIENYLPNDLDYVTYIDADVICLNNPLKKITETINSMNKKKFSIAGRVEGTKQVSNDYFEHLGFDGDKYFNAGVVVINFQDWLKNNMQNSLLDIMRNKYEQIIYWDQDVLNCYFSGEFLELDEKLNFKLELDDNSIGKKDYVKNEVIFLHYSGNGKPWSFDSVTKPNSVFYQEAYQKFFKSKYHTEIRLKKNEFKKLIQLFVFKNKTNSLTPYLFMMNLLILFRKLINYYLK
jgi:lipopolysaccharide biosynthesis glycosyltransferase